MSPFFVPELDNLLIMLLIYEDQSYNSCDHAGRYCDPVADSQACHYAAGGLKVSAEELKVVDACVSDDRGPEVARAQINGTEQHSYADRIN